MLTSRGLPSNSICVIKAEPGKLDIKRREPCILVIILLICLPSAVSNVSGYRCVFDSRSRGREFDPGPVPYFRGD